MSAQEIDEPTASTAPVQPGVHKIPLEKLKPNPYQPRSSIAEEALEELADSIRSRGVIQPILAEADGDGNYTIIAGERRLRAAEKAGLAEIPAIVTEFSDAEKREIALVENIQRENLSPIDEATAYRDIMESARIGQDELARRVGKNRSTVANALRLLKLPDEARRAVADGRVSSGHARALLSLTDPDRTTELLQEIIDGGLSVRVAEQRAREIEQRPERRKKHETATGDGGTRSAGGSAKTAEMRELEDRLIEKLGTKVSIHGSNERGRLEIAYYSVDDLEALYRRLTGDDPPE